MQIATYEKQVMPRNYKPNIAPVLQGDEGDTAQTPTRVRKHLSAPQCWCKPTEIEPGVWVHNHDDKP